MREIKVKRWRQKTVEREQRASVIKEAKAVSQKDAESRCKRIYCSRSQRPRGLRCWFAAARLMGLWVRIPLGHGCLSLMEVVCCQVDVSAIG